MQIGKCQVTNFASYPEASLDFSGMGLTLVSGPTGAGKSTIFDMPYWILFGATSKEGGVDEIRSWYSQDATSGVLSVALEDGDIEVTRIRGKANENDLYWTEAAQPDQKIRGKDITETQKLLETRLGVSAELYLLGAYFAQFSHADAFFVAKAKDRRDVFEKIADLSMPVKISEAVSEERKADKRLLETKTAELSKLSGKAEQLREQLLRSEASRESWEVSNARTLANLQLQADGFDQTKAEKFDKLLASLEALDKLIVPPVQFEARLNQLKEQQRQLNTLRLQRRELQQKLSPAEATLTALERELKKFGSLAGDSCPTCLGPTKNANREKHLTSIEKDLKSAKLAADRLRKEVNDLDVALESESKIAKAYDEIRDKQSNNLRYRERFDADKKALAEVESLPNHFLEQLRKAKAQVNPFTDQILAAQDSTIAVDLDLKKLNSVLEQINRKITTLTALYDLSFNFRAEKLKASVKSIEGSTNECLEKYFDGAIRVRFVMASSDKLEVEIERNGYACTFRQMSGGQRRMLALSFWRSVMKAVAYKAGVHFSLLCFDEPFLGRLDDELATKAFSFFEELEADHESVLVIEHCPAFKGLFSSQISINIQGETSEIVDETDAEGRETEAA